jgi:Ca2+/Na+ antiporter
VALFSSRTATSLPDLLVGISAARNGRVDLAVGDLLGTALINIFVLAGLEMLHPSRGRMLRGRQRLTRSQGR